MTSCACNRKLTLCRTKVATFFARHKTVVPAGIWCRPWLSTKHSMSAVDSPHPFKTQANILISSTASRVDLCDHDHPRRACGCKGRLAVDDSLFAIVMTTDPYPWNRTRYSEGQSTQGRRRSRRHDLPPFPTLVTSALLNALCGSESGAKSLFQISPQSILENPCNRLQRLLWFLHARWNHDSQN
ncbi:hypothetical protein NEOLEDRAFT_145129 [Neolentinus lepideus HHB14362 ss-1]|uniref:Uncharacterized protein n=1 Tax=Neolentinus lepideus HHB14362 ss-1 TaxID=1314782 RepID=A0A165U0W5_9AGAM|nr:hypothetical protein NEOLEDRAFT_145129 [Neolentinus lepideus HHB14362 ss-1]